MGRSPCRERGLKSHIDDAAKSKPSGRSPCRERGLKSFAAALVRRRPSSLPVQGAWIEMARATGPSSGGLSLPVQGAWIEIFRGGACASPSVVAPRAGSVD